MNTPCNTHPERVKIVHPAHPLCGQQVTVQRVLREGQKHYLLVKWPDNGQVCRIPQAWTDQAITVPATSGARFTPQQLSTVRQWVDAHLAVTLDGEVKGAPWSGKEAAFPPPPPLRTPRDSFPSDRSSISNALLLGRGGK